MKCPCMATFLASANPDQQWETPRCGPFTARTTAAALAVWHTYVHTSNHAMMLFHPFHKPKVRSKGSFSGSVPKIYCVLSNAKPSNSSDKARCMLIQLLHLSSRVSMCPDDTGVHLQCAASELGTFCSSF